MIIDKQNKTTTHTILIVEDDTKTSELVRLYLEKSDFQVYNAAEGLAALRIFRGVEPDLVILDLMLPQLDGLDLCRMMRAESDVAIIMLTARTTEQDKLVGLELGADDYVSKPFSPRELVARVRAVLRRAGRIEADTNDIHIHNLYIDFFRHEVRLGQELVHLTIKEFRLLETLARQPGRAFSRLQLLEHVFGFDYDGLERTIDVHIKNLRKKIEPNPSQPTYIQTVYGVGYKFSEDLMNA